MDKLKIILIKFYSLKNIGIIEMEIFKLFIESNFYDLVRNVCVCLDLYKDLQFIYKRVLMNGGEEYFLN